MSRAFARMATQIASTKRNSGYADGKMGAPVVNIASLLVLPMMPPSPEVLERYALQAAREQFVTYTEGAPDVRAGDVLVIGAVEYYIKGAGAWPTDYDYFEILCERVLQ